MVPFIQIQCGQYAQATICVSEHISVQIHPLPAFDNLTVFNHIVDKMEELGLWLMYEMSGYDCP